MPWIKHLVGCPLFEGLDEERIAIFRPATRQIHFAANEMIMTEGEKGEDLLILIEGQVTISKKMTLLAEDAETSTADKTFLTLDASAKPFFGEMGLLMSDSTRTATVKTNSACEIVELDKDRFWEVCAANPEIGFQVMVNIGRRLANNLQRENQNVLKLTTAFSLVLEE